ncbi:hypothetical protein BC831DRAFT_446078 [Entophlyctis helioformis]|nr:hypothetical protein BC831DRAFT_446078 [Entophlyctis helioformis]
MLLQSMAHAPFLTAMCWLSSSVVILTSSFIVPAIALSCCCKCAADRLHR